MIFNGISCRFSTVNSMQYESIGEYWDFFSNIYGRENIKGLGYNWSTDSIEYVIGLIDEELSFDLSKIQKTYPNAIYKKIRLPEHEWKHYRGKTEYLGQMYEEIYNEGILTYEIESFTDEGTWEILICREQLIKIRVATEQDSKVLLDIYSTYVDNTAITFEYTVPTLEEYTERICATLQKYPYLVAEHNGEIIGYAYAGAFKTRAAYDWSVETTIYVKQDCRNMGVGRILYDKLEEILAKQGILNLNACIAYPEIEDEYLTKGSVSFHEKLGYQLVGKFHKSGYKFNRWYDMVWMEKHIGDHEENQPPIKLFKEVIDEEEIFNEKY